MFQTVEQFCQAIEKNQMIPPKEMSYLRNRWFRPGRKEVDQVDRFTRWLVANHFLTEFALDSLRQENSGTLSFEPYRVTERLRVGPLAGALLAIDDLSNQSVAIEIFSSSVSKNPILYAAVHEVVRRAIDITHPYIGDLLDIRESNGQRFLVKAYEPGETLADIIKRRKRIPYLQATKIFAMAFAGLQALHESNIPGGDLHADCLILTDAQQAKKGQRAVKILNAGVPRQFFDNAIPLDQTAALSLAVDAAGDIFRMGCLFYRAVTGQSPFPEGDTRAPTAPAVPVRHECPDIPAMLAETIDECIDLDPTRRPRKAGSVAKTLRVFLASEEEESDVRPEENLVMPEKVTQRIRRRETVETAIAHQPLADEAPQQERKKKEEPAATEPAIRQQPTEGWDRYKPRDRDLMFFLGGVVTFVVLILLLQLVTRWDMVNLVCLFAGATVTYLVHQFIRWRVKGME